MKKELLYCIGQLFDVRIYPKKKRSTHYISVNGGVVNQAANLTRAKEIGVAEVLCMIEHRKLYHYRALQNLDSVKYELESRCRQRGSVRALESYKQQVLS